MVICKNGIDSYATNNYRALRETRGNKFKRGNSSHNKRKQNNSLNEDETSIH
jgi:hypothetical protein